MPFFDVLLWGGIITLGAYQRGAIVQFRLSVLNAIFAAFMAIYRRLRAPARRLVRQLLYSMYIMVA